MTNEELWAAGKLPELWESVERLLYQMARKYYFHHGTDNCARHGVTLEDLQQESYFAFLNAVAAYKPEKGFRFTSYLSRHAENRFRACMGIFTKLDALNYADSMNAPAAEDSETESGDLIPDEKAEAVLAAVDDEAENDYFKGQLKAALTELSPIQAADESADSGNAARHTAGRAPGAGKGSQRIAREKAGVENKGRLSGDGSVPRHGLGSLVL